jgi:uncharacterized protein YndB with AHSA1/START domain
MNLPATIDRSAPVLAHHEIDIDAPRDLVWGLHADVNAWPRWQSDITSAELHGSFAPGERFTWTGFGFTVTATLYAVEDGARTLWGGAGKVGDAREIMGIHEWLFTPTATGTHVETNESIAGEPPKSGVSGMKQQLDGSLVLWLNQLKAAAEA